jgi:hypothetical protein
MSGKIINTKVEDPDYEKAETDLLRAAIKRTDIERFQIMTTLMKMSLLFKKAKITHKSAK